MSIPKVIHYCWFGGNEKSELVKHCISSWKKYCPDWEIVEWNESNFDVGFCSYSAKAYKAKRWGYVTDPIRFKIIYENGGVYLDADVELTRSLDELILNDSFFYYAMHDKIGSGIGFGAVKNHPFVLEICNHYTSLDEDFPFVLSTDMETPIFIKKFPEFYADCTKGKDQLFDVEGGHSVLIKCDPWRYTIHHYTGSWQSPLEKFFNKFTCLKKLYFTIKNK